MKTFKKSEFFTRMGFSGVFLELLDTASETLDIVPVPRYETLTETTHDKDILTKDSKKVTARPINKILSEIHAIINSNDETFADGNDTYWYVEHKGVLSDIGCRLSSDSGIWEFLADIVWWSGSYKYKGSRTIVS